MIVARGLQMWRAGGKHHGDNSCQQGTGLMVEDVVIEACTSAEGRQGNVFRHGVSGMVNLVYPL